MEGNSHVEFISWHDFRLSTPNADVMKAATYAACVAVHLGAQRVTSAQNIRSATRRPGVLRAGDVLRHGSGRRSRSSITTDNSRNRSVSACST